MLSGNYSAVFVQAPIGFELEFKFVALVW